MAASISGVFTIIDRASGPMRRMETQAMKTMAAIEGVGHAQDRAAGGSNKAGREFESTARHMKNMEQSSRGAAGGLDEVDRKSRRTESSIHRLGQKLAGVNQVLRFFGTVLGLLKIPAIGVAIAALAQAIGALAGGLTALLPGLAQAGGAFAALPQTIFAAVQGFGVFKAAMAGVGDALKQGMQLQQQHTQVMQDSAEAHIQAVHGVQEAEYGLMTSQRGVRMAQVALTEARREAVRNLQDLKLAAMGADLSQKRSVLSLREARLELANASVNPQTTDLEMQGLNLSVSESALQVKQANLTQARSHQDLHREQKRGVRGNLSVVAAQNSLTDALHGQKEAAFALASAQRALLREQQRGTGVVAAYRTAMQNLSPPAREFVKHLLRMRPLLKGIQAEAAAGLFPGLNRSLDNLRSAVPLMRRLGRKTGGVIGDETDNLTERMTTPGRLADFERLGNMNAKIVGRMIRGAGNLGEAMVDFMVAAQPFTNWLTKTIEHGTKWVETWAKGKRESGAFAAALDRSKARLQQFGRILKDLWTVLGNVFHAAAPLGDRLWKGVERGADNMAKWTGSADGMARMRDWFDKLYAPLHALGQLTKDLFIAWAHITVNPSFTKTINVLDDHVGDIEKLFNFGSNLGPAAAELLGSLARLFSDLPVDVLSTVVDLFSRLVQGIDWIIRNVPGAKYVLTGLLLAGALRKSIGLVEVLIGKWKDLFMWWRRSPGPPATAPGGMPGAPGVPGAPGTPGGAPPPAPGTMVYGPSAYGTGAKPGFRGRYLDARNAGLSRTNSFRIARTLGRWGRPVGMGARIAAGASRVGGVVGRFGGPLMALSMMAGAFGGSQRWGNANGAAWGALDALDFGTGGFSNWIDPGADKETQGKNEQTALRRAMQSVRRQKGPKAEMAWINRMINTGSIGAAADTDLGSGGTRAKHIKNIINGLKDIRGRLVARDAAAADQTVSSLREAMGVYAAHGQTKAGRRSVVADFGREFKDASMAGKRELSAGVGQWIEELSHGNAAQRRMGRMLAREVKSQWADMGDRIAIVNGTILHGTKQEWKLISSAMTDPAERARQKVSEAFTQMQKMAVGSLMALGYSRSDAKNLVANMDASRAGATRHAAGAVAGHSADIGHASPLRGSELAGHGGATGMRIRGQGLADNVQVAPGHIAAPGELIVNRHTESRLDRVLGMFGTSLGREVAGESMRHAMPVTHARGGRIGADLGGHPGNIAPALRRLIGIMENKFPGLSVTATRDGNHVVGSDHYSGHAVDLGGAYPLMDQAASWINRSGLYRSLKQGIHNPNLSVNAGQHVPSSFYSEVWAGHRNHIHLAVYDALKRFKGGARGGMTAGGVDLTKALLSAPTSGMGGVPGALADRAMAIYAKGINRNIMRGGGGGGSLGAGVSGSNQQMGRQMMLKLWGAGQWPALKALWTGESGWNEAARNSSSGAYGIPQSLPASKMGAAALGRGARAAKAQIAWGLRYIKGRYGSPSAAYRAWLSRSPHWYARGGRVGPDQIGYDAGLSLPGSGGGSLDGRLAYVGDSLGVGTEPLLAHLLHGGIAANTQVGRSSASGLAALRRLMGRGNFGGAVFDLGTNDGSAGALRRSLMSADRLTGNIPLYVATVNGPAAAQKNAMLRRMAGGDIHLIDWAAGSGGLLGGDGIHPSGRGYAQRAHMFANAMGHQGGGRVNWGGWHARGGKFTVSRPTVFGAGESGRETVTVKRPGDGDGGSGRPIMVRIDKIENHRDGDIREHLEREIGGLVEDFNLVGTEAE
jgi:hypothetical protein